MAGEISLDNLSNGELRRVVRDGQEKLRQRKIQKQWDASWRDLRGKLIDRETTRTNILASPTAEEKQRWQGMTPEQVDADIEGYLDRYEQEHIDGSRFVAEVDSIAWEIHINSSPRLRGWRRKP